MVEPITAALAAVGIISSGVKAVRGTLKELAPIEWDHLGSPGMVWRVPDPYAFICKKCKRVYTSPDMYLDRTTSELMGTSEEEGIDRAPIPARALETMVCNTCGGKLERFENINWVESILVREYERAVFLRDGKLYGPGALPPGRWILTKMVFLGRMEVIWVSMQTYKINWGVGRVLLQEGVEVGAHGIAMLRIQDPVSFVLNVVAAQRYFSPTDLEKWVKDMIQSAVRTELSHYDPMTLQRERESFIATVRTRLNEMFTQFGLEFLNLEIPNFHFPQDYIEAMKSVPIARFERDAQIERGRAFAKVLTMMNEAGVDPVRYQLVQALTEYGKAPRAAGPFSGDFYMPLVFAMMLKDGAIPMGVKTELSKLMPDLAEKAEKPEVKEKLKDVLYCPNCGNKISKDWKFCPTCKAEIPKLP